MDREVLSSSPWVPVTGSMGMVQRYARGGF